MSDVKVLVRTWGHSREGVYHLLKSVHYPIGVIQRIQQWAIEQQENLLQAKYCEQSDLPVLPGGKSAYMPCTQAALDTSNQLWKELQREGYNSEDDRNAITFLIGLHRDNPELIDLSVTEQFLAELKQS